MELLFVGLAVGAGAWLARRSGLTGRVAVGFVARKSGFVAGRVRAEIAATQAIAREQYERGRAAGKPTNDSAAQHISS